MKIRVVSEFYDKFHTSTLFKVGTVLDFDDDRANDIISKKLAEPYVEPEEKKKPGRPKTEQKPEPAKAEVKAAEADSEVEKPKTDVKEKAE
jgi:hypothetical protein